MAAIFVEFVARIYVIMVALWNRAYHYILVHGQVTIIFVVSVCLFTGSIARSANLPVFSLLRGQF